MQVSHRTLLNISGIVWLAIGVMLLNLGIRFIMDGSFMQAENQFGAIILIALALITGNIKGRFVLRKAAMRSFERIKLLSNPTPLSNIYSKANYILIGLMMGIGMGMKYLGIPPDVRGFIDIAVGAALIQGALCYFNMPTTCGSENPS